MPSKAHLPRRIRAWIPSPFSKRCFIGVKRALSVMRGNASFQENHFRDPQEEFTDALFGGGCDSTPNPSVSGPPHKGMSRALASNLVGRGVQSSSRPSQVTFLRELMLRQKVCFAKRKEFKYFPNKNHPELWDSSQFSHFFSHFRRSGRLLPLRSGIASG